MPSVGLRERIDHAAKPGFGGIDAGGPVFEFGTRAKRHAIEAAQRHHQRAAIAEAHDFARNMAAARNGDANLPAQAYGPGGPGDFDRQPLDPGHAPEAAQGGYGLNFF